MATLILRTPEYERLLTRWNELDAILYPTYRERTEKRVLGEQLAALEAEYDRRAGARGEAIAELTDDYAQLMAMGDLGGCELV